MIMKQFVSVINFLGAAKNPKMATPFFGRGRVYAIYVSRLLKVVETQFFLKMTAIGKFNMDLPFSFLLNPLVFS